MHEEENAMLHFIITIGLAALAALGASPVLAQIGNPAGMTPSTPIVEPGTPAPGQPNTPDRLFVFLMGTGGLAEVQAAKLAGDKAGSDAVKGLAGMMVRDHAQANDKLAGLARQSGIPLPAQV